MDIVKFESKGWCVRTTKSFGPKLESSIKVHNGIVCGENCSICRGIEKGIECSFEGMPWECFRKSLLKTRWAMVKMGFKLGDLSDKRF